MHSQKRWILGHTAREASLIKMACGHQGYGRLAETDIAREEAFDFTY